MKILHILPSVDPKGGGPMEGVRQYGIQLKSMGHEVEVLTLDDPAAPFVANFPHTVHPLGPTAGSYGYNARLTPWLKTHASGYDVIIVNGLWQYHGFGSWRALHRMKVPYFVFTHGMLDPWFKHTYPLKHLKKWLYWPWAEYRLLRDARAVLFTCEEERLLARKSFWLYRVREAVITYGTKTPPSDAEALREKFYAAYPDLRGKRVLLFLSRIQEKKGCDLLIEAFAKVARQDASLHLLMAGPDQTGWMATLQAQAQRLGVAERITWPGMLQGDMKWGAFYASEAFVLPSHQENFGIVVAEALGCGLPVLISDKVNIWREIEADGAGIVNTDTVDGTVQTLQRWLALDVQQRQNMAQQAKATFAQRYTVEAMAQSLLEVLTRQLGLPTPEVAPSLAAPSKIPRVPSISIITIVRNDIPGLERTRASVANQTFRDFEWLVVDGASTDGTAQLALSFDEPWATVTSEPDKGIYDAMNKGLARATRDYVVFLNAGDTFSGATLLERVTGRLQKTDADFLYGDSLEAFGSAQPVHKVARGHEHVAYGMFACHQTMFYRRKLLGEQRYDPRFQIAGDYCFTAQFLQKKPRIERMHDALCVFDLTGVSISNRVRGREENWGVQRDILRLSLARRCANRLVYLATAFLATRLPGVYKALRFRKAS
jgi:glycosyltransferase involved in cell wall biosynthesis